MGGAVVDDGVDRLPGGNLLLDDIEEANEFLMALALPVAADRAVAARSLVVPCNRARCVGAAFFSGNPGSVRLSAWIRLSSTDRTIASAGGST
jgi:hypothetical protein